MAASQGTTREFWTRMIGQQLILTLPSTEIFVSVGGVGINNTTALFVRPNKKKVDQIAQAGWWHDIGNNHLAPRRGTLLISPPCDEYYFWHDLPRHYVICAGRLYAPSKCSMLFALATTFFNTNLVTTITRGPGKDPRSLTNAPTFHLLTWCKFASTPYISSKTWTQDASCRLTMRHMLAYFHEHFGKCLLPVIHMHDPDLYVKLCL